MVWPGKIKPGSEYDRSIYIADIFNTVMDATGQAIPAAHESDGVSLLPVFSGKQLPPREFIWYYSDLPNAPKKYKSAVEQRLNIDVDNLER
jgi:arylsulfatase A-like enzyme